MKKLALFLVLVSLTAGMLSAQTRRRNPEFDRFNPSYHFYPSGVPTGLFYEDGYYYNGWGRYYSTDLVHWTPTEATKRSSELRAKLMDPNLTEEARQEIMRSMPRSRLGGSGTIVVDTKNVAGYGPGAWLAYYHNEMQPFRTQVIGVSYSLDKGASWTRDEERYPILNIDSREFRDPKIFWHEQTQRWIMAIGWADAPKIRFYYSHNLLDWTYMSDFGPWGATNGVWECTDFFPLPVDGDPSNVKWVIALSVQPYTGQYFVGDFDGERFVLDEEYAHFLDVDPLPKGEVLFDFEHGIDEWEMEGTAFYESPTDVPLYRQGAVMGRVGRYYVNSYHNEGKSEGRITSPEFFITKDYINFKIGGAYAPGLNCVDLLVDGKVVRTETGRNAGSLEWTGWDVSEFRGKKARIRIVSVKEGDNVYTNVTFGPSVYVDQIMLCDALKTREPEHAFWFDYGQDFYAVRSWATYAPGENRRVWTAWMGSWRYNSLEPVSGIQTVPREVRLKTFPEGIRMVQLPLEELKTLRGKGQFFGDVTFEGAWTPKKFKPANNVYEMVVEFENIDAESFGVRLCMGGSEKTTIGYDVAAEELYFDRRYSGLSSFVDFHPAVFKGPMKNRDNKVKIHLFVDNCSVEVFGNDGETCISNKIYPAKESTGVEFFSAGGKVTIKSVSFYPVTGSVM